MLHRIAPPPNPLPANYIAPGELHIGKFLNAVINFVIVASVVYFLVVVPMQKLLARLNKPVPAPEPTTRPCPQCLSEIPLAATRCKFCTQPVTA